MAMSATLPKKAQDITDGWLSDALGEDVHVTAREPIGSPFACEVSRLTLEGSGPASVVIKLPTTSAVRQMLDAINAYGREILFYRDIAPQLPVRTPRVLAAVQAEDSTDFVLVLEDLADHTAADPFGGFTPEQAEAVVDSVAAFHAWSWDKPEILDRFAPSFWPVLSEPGQMLQGQYGQMFGAMWAARREPLSELLPPAAIAVADRFGEVQSQLVQALATPTCITHGELRGDNLLFAPDGTPVIFDFQTAQQECGIRELAYLLAASMHPDVIAAEEEGLLRRYCDQLAANGVQGYSFDQAREQYRHAAAYNLAWPIMANIRWEDSPPRGRQVLDELTRRCGAAVERTGGLV